MPKYLVTGATGFIGSRLLGLLKTKECDVRLLAKSKVENYETVLCNLGQDKIPSYAVLLTALVDRFGVSCMRDFELHNYLQNNKAVLFPPSHPSPPSKKI